MSGDRTEGKNNHSVKAWGVLILVGGQEEQIRSEATVLVATQVIPLQGDLGSLL